MKYIKRIALSGFDFGNYEHYLDREGHELAPRIHGPELLTIERFCLEGRQTFHDARFDRFTATAVAAEDGESEDLSVDLRLRGPYFDRYFELSYKGVRASLFQLPSAHDDLLMHEIREENGLLVHEFLFAHEKLITISCRELHFVEAIQAES